MNAEAPQAATVTRITSAAANSTSSTAAEPWATAACMVCRRCSTATSSCRGERAAPVTPSHSPDSRTNFPADSEAVWSGCVGVFGVRAAGERVFVLWD